MASVRAVDFEVGRTDLGRCRFVERPGEADTPIADDEVLVRVDCFALTANNVTYGRVGEALGYWTFFPAEEGWGRIPVWGFGEVVRSSREDLPVGERLFGYFPMSTTWVMKPKAVGGGVVIEGSAHRQALPPFYNGYSRTAEDPLYAPDTEALQMLFRPLFLTAFLIDDWLGADDLFGARSVVLTSASSKTAIALAERLSRNRRAPGGVVGLTSAANREFVAGLGLYDRTLLYDEVDSLPADVPIAIVDMAGNPRVLSALHHRMGAGVRSSCLVGITHGGGLEPPPGLPGATPSFFFAPDQAARRAEEWGAADLASRTAAAWRDFVSGIDGKLRIVEGRGEADVERAYRATLEGSARPDEGLVLSLA